MASYLIVLAAVCAVSLAQDTCDYKLPEKDIDWDRVKAGPWKWSLYTTSDEFQDFLVCSSVMIGGDSNETFTMQFQYGQEKHQVFTLEGEYLNSGEYKIDDFAASWRRIVRYNNPRSVSNKVLAEETSSPRKDNIVFYTDYRNYFISAICLPNGHMSVAAFTMHRRTTPQLARRINNVLVQHNVNAVPFRANCGKILRAKATKTQ